MTSCVHKMCGKTYGQTNMKRAITLTKINHPWNRYNMGMLRSWPIKIPNMNKMRQTTNDLSCVHKMCEWTYGQTNMKMAITLAKINHPWNWYNMRMLRSWSTKKPNMNKMRQTTNDLSCVHKMCEWIYGQTNMKRAITLAKINHPWNRYNMGMLRSWPIKIPNMNKMRQTTNDLSCVHKMCEWTYGQTNMKRAITLAKINHPWNWYNMHMLRSWPTKILNMNKMRQKTND